MSMTNYLENKVAKMTLGISDPSQPTAVYGGLLSELSNDGDLYTEFSGSNYKRVRLRFEFDDPSCDTVCDKSIIDWPAADDDWGTVKYIGIFDQKIGGSLLYYSEAGVPKFVAEGTQFRINKCGLSVRLWGAYAAYLRYHMLAFTLAMDTYCADDFKFLRVASVGAGLVSDINSINEPSESYGYSRRTVSSSDWQVGVDGIYKNADAILFQADGGDWGVIKCIGLFSQYGNLLYVLDLAESAYITDGDSLMVEAGKLAIKLR